MNIAVKYFAIIVVLAFAGVQVMYIVKEFSDTRIITVTKKVPNTQTLELKGYHITKDHFEKADVRVQPNNFSDYLLLTSYKGNLLSIMLKIGACLCVAWYAFKLKPYNLLSIRQYGTLFLAFILYVFSVFAYNSGMQHNSEFWNYTYWHDKSGPVIQKGFFVVDDARHSYSFIVLAFICLFYQYFVGYPKKLATDSPVT
jgi:hypothetical protein